MKLVANNAKNLVLASCSAIASDEHMHNTVVLTNAQTGTLLDSLQHNENWKRPAGAATSLVFGGKSRYLCVGDMSGAVCLWDLKKKVRARQYFHDGEPALQVSLDRTDTYVLSLSSQAMRSYKVREGVPSTAWRSPRDCRFTKFACSTLEPQLAAIGTDNGSILMYDVTDAHSSETFLALNHRHSSPVTGVAFSCTNDKLLASTSQDGSLQFFDKGSGAFIEELARLPTRISSLTFNSDGYSCAIGTEAGEVLIYDLRRTGSDCLASIYVQGVVRSLHFSPPPKKRGVANEPTSSLNRVVSSTPEMKKESSSTPGLSLTPRQYEQQRPPSSLASEDPRTTYQGPSESGPNQLVYQATSSHHGGSTPKSRCDSTYGGMESLPTYASEGRAVPTTAATVVTLPEIRHVIRDEVEKLQDELEESLRNLHMDMIKQFHQQSEELNAALASQLAAMDQLREENQRLREENDFLKRLQQQHVGHDGREKNRGSELFFGR